MIRFAPFVALVWMAGLAACSSTPSPRLVATPVRQGMTSAELLAAFGRPLRVESGVNGGHDWFYHFGSQEQASRPFFQWINSETERSYSTGQTNTTTTTMKQAPIHLSPSGRVVGAIPSGRIVVE